MSIHTSRTPRRQRRVFLAFGILAGLALVTASCIAQTSKRSSRTDVVSTGKQVDIDRVKVDVPNVEGTVTADDIQYASYGVLHARGGAQRESTYRVAYVKKGGEMSILSGKSGFEEVELTSTGMPARIEDFLHMGPIVAIVGDRRQFTVGETYDSAISEPKLGPNFRFVCDREEDVAGIHGYHLTVTSQRSGKVEMELILSPSYPFPLYVKEFVGSQPLQLILLSTDGKLG